MTYFSGVLNGDIPMIAAMSHLLCVLFSCGVIRYLEHYNIKPANFEAIVYNNSQNIADPFYYYSVLYIQSLNKVI